MAICAYDLCTISFTPKVPHQKFCCKEHRIAQDVIRQEIKRQSKKKTQKMCTSCGFAPRGKGKRFLCDACYRSRTNDTDEEYIISWR